MPRKHKPSWYVWSWLNASEETIFLGMAQADRNGTPPWTALFRDRFKISSPITKYLRTCHGEPARGVVGMQGAMVHSDASVLYSANLQKLLADNAQLYGTRDLETYKHGGGQEKAVVSPEGEVYISVREAARDLNISHGTLVRRLQNSSKTGWKYL